MIRSMTGYGRGEAAAPRLVVTAECKSLNHRHLDVAIKLPRVLAPMEMDARRLVQATLARGRVERNGARSAVRGWPWTIHSARHLPMAGEVLNDVPESPSIT